MKFHIKTPGGTWACLRRLVVHAPDADEAVLAARRELRPARVERAACNFPRRPELGRHLLGLRFQGGARST